MNSNIFRSYDIRGKYGIDFDNYDAYKIGQGYASILKNKYNQNACVVSRDNRISSPILHRYLVSGLLDSGIDVYDLGAVTTPLHYYGRYKTKSNGIMITASHNPKDENGFKFSFNGFSNAREEEVMMLKDVIMKEDFISGHGKQIVKDFRYDYMQFIQDNLNISKNKKIKVVFDLANGATTLVIKYVLNGLNIDYTLINSESDGNFPNHPADPSVYENNKQLIDKVIELNADLGIGFDGDGDRIGIIDNEGNVFPIEKYGIIIAKEIMKENKNNNTFLYDAKSSRIFKDEMEKVGAKCVISRTGSSYTEYNIHKNNIPFGFQYVGHIGINDRMYGVESAIYAALRLIEYLSNNDKKLSDINKEIKDYYTSDELRIDSNDNVKRICIDKIKNYFIIKGYKFTELDGLIVEFNNGWGYVRASNTGPTINIRCESTNKDGLENIEKLLKYLVKHYNKKDD